MVEIVLAETAHLDVSRLFGITDVKLGCLVERVRDVIYHFWARITRPLELSCFQACQRACKTMKTPMSPTLQQSLCPACNEH